ncbi:MAG: hypothetical protein GY925_00300 [Actinomycetia bacterium]|nr:hypothetical protein [Actinomycetes bacterium]
METLAGLDNADQSAVERAMHAVVRRDRAALENLGADNDSNPWVWADDYGGERLGLAHPPGPVGTWPGSTTRTDARPGWCGVDVAVWATRHEMTDLTLQLDLERTGDGTVETTFRDLRVM